MAGKIVDNVRLTALHGTVEEFESRNPILLDGEIGVETQIDSSKKIKVGDGITQWNSLPYLGSGDSTDNFYSGIVSAPVNFITASGNTLTIKSGTVMRFPVGFDSNGKRAFFDYTIDEDIVHTLQTSQRGTYYIGISTTGYINQCISRCYIASQPNKVQCANDNGFTQIFVYSPTTNFGYLVTNLNGNKSATPCPMLIIAKYYCGTSGSVSDITPLYGPDRSDMITSLLSCIQDKTVGINVSGEGCLLDNGIDECGQGTILFNDTCKPNGDYNLVSGYNNKVLGDSTNCLFTGSYNTITSPNYNSIFSGQNNTVSAAFSYGLLLGQNNLVSTTSSTQSYYSILFGENNTVTDGSVYGSLLGGGKNKFSSNVYHSLVISQQSSSMSIPFNSIETSIVSGDRIEPSSTSAYIDSSIVSGEGQKVNTYCSIIGGYNHTLEGKSYGSLICGGYNKVTGSSGHNLESSLLIGSSNNVSGGSASIITGTNNSLDNIYQSIVYGSSNKLTSSSGSGYIVGGVSNTLNKSISYSIISGYSNTVNSDFVGSLLLGQQNSILEDSQQSHSIICGTEGVVGGTYGTVWSGRSNKAQTRRTALSEIPCNNYYSIISGTNNKCYLYYSIITGDGNICSSSREAFGSLICGYYNTLQVDCGVVLGKYNNITDSVSSIVGGDNNTIYTTAYRSVLIGNENYVSCAYNSIITGINNEVCVVEDDGTIGSVTIDSTIVNGANNKVKVHLENSIISGSENEVTNHPFSTSNSNKSLNIFGTGLKSSVVYNDEPILSKTLIGQYNEEETSNEALLIVGNGTSDDNRSNAAKLDVSGNLTIGGDLKMTDSDGVIISLLEKIKYLEEELAKCVKA